MKTESTKGSAGVPPAVSGASRPRFGSVTIHDQGHLPHWEKDGATNQTVRYVAQNPLKAGLQGWPWVWVWGQDAPTTAAEDGGAA